MELVSLCDLRPKVIQRSCGLGSLSMSILAKALLTTRAIMNLVKMSLLIVLALVVFAISFVLTKLESLQEVASQIIWKKIENSHKQSCSIQESILQSRSTLPLGSKQQS